MSNRQADSDQTPPGFFRVRMMLWLLGAVFQILPGACVGYVSGFVGTISGVFLGALGGLSTQALPLIGAAIGAVVGSVRFVRSARRNAVLFEQCRRATDDTTRQIAAMTNDEARESVLSAIATATCVRAVAAGDGKPTLPPGTHESVVELFSRFDRVTVEIPGTDREYTRFDRAHVEAVPFNTDGVIVGRFLANVLLVVHCPTGLVTCHQPPFAPGEVAECAANPSLGHDASVWHRLASDIAVMEIGKAMRRPG